MTKEVSKSEAKNRQLFDSYSKNEKRLMKVLKKVKEENQTLLKNLKKLLGKKVITSKILKSNPVYDKFLEKLREISHESEYKSIFKNPENLKLESSKKKKSNKKVLKQNKAQNKKLKNENIFIIKSTHKLETPRNWVSALYYGSNLKRKKKH